MRTPTSLRHSIADPPASIQEATMPRTTARDRRKYDVHLHSREKLLIAIYRALPDAAKLSVDRALSKAWVEESPDLDCSKEAHQLKAGHCSSGWLMHFANVGLGQTLESGTPLEESRS
jgi:hypothetical protein